MNTKKLTVTAPRVDMKSQWRKVAKKYRKEIHERVVQKRQLRAAHFAAEEHAVAIGNRASRRELKQNTGDIPDAN